MSSRPPGSLPTVPAGPELGAPDPAVVQTAWARVFMDSLRRAGVTAAVISPGSRSTPFVLAAEHAGVATHTVIDERSAGFFALGHARATGRPVALICTSGTAGAHYYPAVIEAAQSFLPLVVITADRPPELHGCAAPQTIDQTRLFGAWARLYADLGPAHDAPASLRAVRRKAAQAVARALAPVPGPVHINAPARKPLEPARPRSAADIAVVRRADDILREAQTQVVTAPVRAADPVIDSLTQACAAATRGLIVAGPLAPCRARSRVGGQREGQSEQQAEGQTEHLARAAHDLARATGFPLLVEAASQLRFAALDPAAHEDVVLEDVALIDGFDLLLSSAGFRRSAAAELILHIGPPPTSKAWAEYRAQTLDAVHIVIAEHGWNDPHSSADMLIVADMVDTTRRLATAVGARRSPAGSAWAARFRAGNDLVWRCVDEVVAADPAGADEAMSEGQAMRAVAAAVPAGAYLALGNSLPIRTIDTYCRARAMTADVLPQRGANGIDGIISAAAGAAWSPQPGQASRPVVAVLGDVSFVHDLGGLAVASRSRAPVCLVVIDNDGGRIFEQLPISRADYGVNPALYQAHWLTPPGCDMQAAAALFGAAFATATTPQELTAAVRDASARPGCTVVRAVVEPTSAPRDRRRLIEAVDAAVASELADERAGLADQDRGDAP